MAVPLLAWRAGVNAVLAFWTAYVLTRPLGASVADWLAKRHDIGGGLDYGDGTVAVVSIALLIVGVGYVMRVGGDVQEPR